MILKKPYLAFPKPSLEQRSAGQKYLPLVFFLITLCFIVKKEDLQASTPSPLFETTRLKSTAGAGVGSILMDEAAVLNPAPLAFFNLSSFYVQKYDTKWQGGSSPDSETDSYGFIVADAKGALKGSISYLKHNENSVNRKRFSVALGQAISKTSALGIIYSHTKETHFGDLKNFKDKKGQFNFGLTHAVDQDLTLGLLVVDPFKKNRADTQALIGAQYLLKRMVSLILDLGFDYNRDPKDTLIYKGAIQLSLFSDFFLRGGVFRDKIRHEKGNGFGGGWVSPRLVFDIAVKNTNPLSLSPNNKLRQKKREFSLSLSYRF